MFNALNRRKTALTIIVGLLTLAGTVFGQAEVAPAPPSIGADIPLTYFGPAPSQVLKELVGPYQLLKSGEVNLQQGTVTIPLYRGQLKDKRNVWYVLTDTDDQANAASLGLNFSGKLTYANIGNAVRNGHIEKDGTLTFDRGAVDFSPELVLKPGAEPNPFPPTEFKPGAVGDKDYTPLVRIDNAGGHIYNASIVSFNTSADQLKKFCDGGADHKITHDKVVKICPEGKDGGSVTLALTAGFSFAKPVLYLSLEANNALPATMEQVTLAPALNDLPVGRDDSAFSALERLFAVTNGPTGAGNPQRQGFNSALSGEGAGPLNVLGGIPTVATDYSPLWDLNVYEWTKDAIAKGYRSRATEEFFILGLAEKGFITGPGGAKFGSTGFIVNCPIVWRFL